MRLWLAYGKEILFSGQSDSTKELQLELQLEHHKLSHFIPAMLQGEGHILPQFCSPSYTLWFMASATTSFASQRQWIAGEQTAASFATLDVGKLKEAVKCPAMPIVFFCQGTAAFHQLSRYKNEEKPVGKRRKNTTQQRKGRRHLSCSPPRTIYNNQDTVRQLKALGFCQLMRMWKANLEMCSAS